MDENIPHSMDSITCNIHTNLLDMEDYIMGETLIMIFFMILNAIGIWANKERPQVIGYSIAFGVVLGLFVRFICKGVT